MPRSAADRACFSAIITGRVQGVGFRYSACHEALRLGLTGWVRNHPDESVEVLAEGPPNSLKQFEDWLHQGPPCAWIEAVLVEYHSPSNAYSNFTIEI